jgi:hypothetical protein
MNTKTDISNFTFSNDASILESFYEENQIEQLQGNLDDFLKLEQNDEYKANSDERIRLRKEYDDMINKRIPVEEQPILEKQDEK